MSTLTILVKYYEIVAVEFVKVRHNYVCFLEPP